MDESELGRGVEGSARCGALRPVDGTNKAAGEGSDIDSGVGGDAKGAIRVGLVGGVAMGRLKGGTEEQEQDEKGPGEAAVSLGEAAEES